MLLDKEPMMETDSPVRIARVAQLERLYRELEPQEISPWDTDAANLQNFLDNIRANGL